MKLTLFLTVCSALSVVLALPARPHAQPSLDRRENNDDGVDSDSNWVTSWTTMPQLCEPANLPPAPYNTSSGVFRDSTLRQTIKITQGGSALRIRFSNVFGGSVLPVDAVTVAMTASNNGSTGGSSIDPGSVRQVTFSRGKGGFKAPNGAGIVSDPIAWDVGDGATLAISMYLREGQSGSEITAHPGSRTTSFAVGGNRTGDTDLEGATGTDHWYFISGVEVVPRQEQAAAIAVVGDSIADGRGSTTNRNNRWTDLFYERLRQAGKPISVLNQGAGGNRVLADGLGPNALGRIDRDVIAQTGVRWAIVLEGVNDIGTAPADKESQMEVMDDLIDAYTQMVTRMHAQEIKVYGGTITPFGNNSYDDPEGLRAGTREALNGWIRESGVFDAVIDFDEAVRDPEDPKRLREEFDVGPQSGDGLHPNPLGYQAMADVIPLELFQ